MMTILATVVVVTGLVAVVVVEIDRAMKIKARKVAKFWTTGSHS